MSWEPTLGTTQDVPSSAQLGPASIGLHPPDFDGTPRLGGAFDRLTGPSRYNCECGKSTKRSIRVLATVVVGRPHDRRRHLLLWPRTNPPRPRLLGGPLSAVDVGLRSGLRRVAPRCLLGPAASLDVRPYGRRTTAYLVEEDRRADGNLIPMARGGSRVTVRALRRAVRLNGNQSLSRWGRQRRLAPRPHTPRDR